MKKENIRAIVGIAILNFFINIINLIFGFVFNLESFRFYAFLFVTFCVTTTLWVLLLLAMGARIDRINETNAANGTGN